MITEFISSPIIDESSHFDLYDLYTLFSGAECFTFYYCSCSLCKFFQPLKLVQCKVDSAFVCILKCRSLNFTFVRYSVIFKILEMIPNFVTAFIFFWNLSILFCNQVIRVWCINMYIAIYTSFCLAVFCVVANCSSCVCYFHHYTIIGYIHVCQFDLCTVLMSLSAFTCIYINVRFQSEVSLHTYMPCHLSISDLHFYSNHCVFYVLLVGMSSHVHFFCMCIEICFFSDGVYILESVCLLFSKLSDLMFMRFCLCVNIVSDTNPELTNDRIS